MVKLFVCPFHYLSGWVGGGWVLEEARLRLNSAPVGLSLAGAGAELGNNINKDLVVFYVLELINLNNFGWSLTLPVCLW